MIDENPAGVAERKSVWARYGKRAVGAVMLLVLLGLLALPKLKPDDSAAAGPGASRARDTLQVSAYVVGPTALVDRIFTTGTVRANESVDLVSEASGKLTNILVREGTAVEAGALLLKINDADLQAQRERAVYRLRLAEEREKRQRQILDKGGISQEAYDEVLNEVNVLRAEINVIDAQIEKTEIRAPFSGVVGLRYVSEGSFISPQTRIATLQSLDPIKIDFTVPERYSGRLRPGDDITFRVQGVDRTYRGRIYAVEPNISENTRSVQLRAQTGNSDRTLVPGAFAEVEVSLGTEEEALTVPAIAVVPQLSGASVFALNGGRVEQRPVTTGMRTDSVVQVLTGISSGDTVLTSGLQQVRPGLPVRITDLRQ